MKIISEKEETNELYALRAEAWSHLNEITEPTMVRRILVPKNDINNHFLHFIARANLELLRYTIIRGGAFRFDIWGVGRDYI